MEIFGYNISRKKEQEKESFVEKIEDDGALSVTASSSNYINQYLNYNKSANDEAEFITKYRRLSLEPEVEYALDDIVNEAISTDEREVVSINLDDIEGISSRVKNLISEEFKYIVNMMNFNNIAYETFRRWIIDGRMYYHVIVDDKNLANGIQELRYIDPRKIRKVRVTEKIKKKNVEIKKTKEEYFMFNEIGFKTTAIMGEVKGLKILPDSVIHVTSGLMNEDNTMVLSYLHKALKPLNNLRSLEDSVIIYRITRAPERRIFYIEVGGLPKAKAEQRLRDAANNFKKKLVYDRSTGEMKDDKRFLSMNDDFYLATREGSSTKIDTLPGGQNLGQMEDVEYFLKKLHKALNIPLSRLEENSGFALGRTSEISRDEVKFNKFISRIRKRFSLIFQQALEKQLILKNIVTIEEWDKFKNNIYFDFAVDNHFAELKNMDINLARLDVVDRMNDYIGVYYSKEWVRKEVLKQSEEQITDINKEMQLDLPVQDTDGPGDNKGKSRE